MSQMPPPRPKLVGASQEATMIDAMTSFAETINTSIASANQILLSPQGKQTEDAVKSAQKVVEVGLASLTHLLNAMNKGMGMGAKTE